MFPMRKTVLGVLAMTMAAATSPASATVITAASTDFDTPWVTYPGVSVTFGPYTSRNANGSYSGSNGKSWSGTIATQGGTSLVQLQLTGLPTHTMVSVDFLLGFLSSWDSDQISWVGPDYLYMYIDGTPVAMMTTVVAGGSTNDYDGGTLLVDNGQIDDYFNWADDLVDMGTAGFLTFAHTASTLTIGWQAGGAGYQSWPDEYWGIDAITVKLTVPDGHVPEPASLALMGLGMVGLAAVRRRKRCA